jgi:hypothetical protein
MAATAAGIQAARLDVNPTSRAVVASVKIRGRVIQRELPTGRILTIDEILAMLFPGPQPAARSGHIHIEVETVLSDPPPP